MKNKKPLSRIHIPAPPHTQLPTFLTGPEVQRILQISPATFTRMMQRGDLPAMRVAERLWRVKLQDLEAYIAQQSPDAA